MTSRSRYTLSVQSFVHIILRFTIRLFVKPFQTLLTNNETGTVPECLRPRPEHPVFDEAVETVDKFRWERDRNGLSVTAHTSS
ncbi:MAG: hypothetical protein ACI9K3_001521 [Halovenus sp.]|jgi:hypothetical protein